MILSVESHICRYRNGILSLPPGRGVGDLLYACAIGDAWLEASTLTSEDDLPTDAMKVDARGRFCLPNHGLRQRFAVADGEQVDVRVWVYDDQHFYLLARAVAACAPPTEEDRPADVLTAHRRRHRRRKS